MQLADPEVRAASGSAPVTGIEGVQGRRANGEAASLSLLAMNGFARDGGGR